MGLLHKPSTAPQHLGGRQQPRLLQPQPVARSQIKQLSFKCPGENCWRNKVVGKVASLSGIPLASTPLPLTAKQLQELPEPSLESDSYVPPHINEWQHDPLLMSGCEPGKQLRVAMLLSGGVDSSVALQLLRSAGHHVKAFYLQIWFQQDFRNFWSQCPWEEDIGFAKEVCEKLGVELELVPMTVEYWDHVVSHFVDEIRAGRTPNPDMMCNSRVKFGAFFEFLDKQYGHGFDRVATGHYARVVRGTRCATTQALAAPASPHHQDQNRVPDELDQCSSRCRSSQEAGPGPDSSSSSSSTDGSSSGGCRPTASQHDAEEVLLAMTPDAVKDQTYFLASLSPQQLRRAMFPLGGLTKPQVRKLAAAAQLSNMSRKDSQGICFLGKVKFQEFVREHLGEWPGLIVEHESDAIVGAHQGHWFYTPGQRGGIKLPGGPWYVVRKDPLLNTVFVSKQYYESDKVRNTLRAGPINWVSQMLPNPSKPVFCKVRHGPHMHRCQSLQLDEAKQYAHVVLEGNDQGLAAGQYAVFYQDGICLGAGKMV